MNLHGTNTLCPDMPSRAAPDREPFNRVLVNEPALWLAQESALVAGQALGDADLPGPLTNVTHD